jgi:hypothetical protein
MDEGKTLPADDTVRDLETVLRRIASEIEAEAAHREDALDEIACTLETCGNRLLDLADTYNARARRAAG